MGSGLGGSRLAPAPTDVLLAVVGAGLGLLAGTTLSGSLTQGALLVGGCLLLMLAATKPIVIGVVALLGTFASQRVGAGVLPIANGVSYADLLLVIAAPLALTSLVASAELRRLKAPLVALAVYLACLLPTVVPDDSSRGWFEWGHRLFLVGGALLVGAWLVREGRTRTALRLLVVAGCGLAVLAMLDSARRGFEPAYPYGLNKNFVGAQLSMVLILAVAARRAIGMKLPVQLVVVLVAVGGLLASQSRGGVLAAVVGIVIVVLVSPRSQSRAGRGLLLLLAAGLTAFVFFSIRADLEQPAADVANNSIGVRRQVEARSLEIWRTSPATGVGLKYFNSGEYGPLAQAPNIVVDNELAESGVIGLIGFIVLQGTAILAALRRRRDGVFVIVGGACVAALLVHGMVDIYWIAGSVTLPFILLGMALATRPPGEEPEDVRGGAPAVLHPEVPVPAKLGRHRD